ncbi:sensor histidine kinase [Microtetraspora malaysiensis]|uniref:sensor histidine kinase n=1 Tax=Microtetraspora malaysiensis TaxID=161358 RepID=UPI003D92CE1D
MSRRARWIVIAVLAGFSSVYALAAPYGVLLAGPMFVMQLPYVLRLPRPARLLPAQAVIAYAATAWLDVPVGLLGFLGGSLLLTRLWPLAIPVAVSAAIIDRESLDSTISMILISLIIYGLMRLVEQVDEVQATRLALAAAAVSEERLRIAAQLNDGLGRALAGITQGLSAEDPSRESIAEVVGTARLALAEARSAASGYRATSLSPEITTARAMLSAAGVPVEVQVGHTEPLGPPGALLAAVLRESVTQVVRHGGATFCAIETRVLAHRVRLRVTNDGVLNAGDELFGDLPTQLTKAGGTLTTSLSPQGHHVVEAMLPQPSEESATLYDEEHAYALSISLLTAILVGFSAKALLQAPSSLLIPGLVLLAVIVFMHLSLFRGRHTLGLLVMAALLYAPIPLFGRAWLGIAGFLAGPLLLALPWTWGLYLVAGVMASVAVIGVLLGLPTPVVVNYTVSTLVTGLVIYSLSTLAQVVKELREAKEELARAAVVEERLRAARDLHDLLGHSLAAILLKCELARRLDAPRARVELAEALEMAERAKADLRAVSGGQLELELAAEAESARSVLTAAGIEVSLSLGHEALDSGAETVLSAVLREAVTNVLRHSSARHCAIATVTEGKGIRLRVRNDGVASVKGRPGSAGVGNLTTRLETLGGRLATSHGEGRFELTAWAPYEVAAVGSR